MSSGCNRVSGGGHQFSMFGFIKRLFSGQPASAPGIRPANLPSQSPAPATPPRGPQAILQREELIDARTRIAGYRFSARRPDASGQSDPQATIETLAAGQVARFAELRLALIPLAGKDWAAFDYQPLIGPCTAFLLARPDETAEADAWAAQAQAIRQSGARLALPVDERADAPPTEEAADFLLLDFSAYSLPNFEKKVRRLRRLRPQTALIVDNIGSWPEFRYCLSLGIAYCLGPFTTRPDDEQQAEEISQSRLVLIEMLNMLRQQADLEDITTVARRDPGVAVKLVAMANSPLGGLAQPVTGVDQAIMVLGREQLYRWLTIGIYRAGDGSPRDEVLLELSLARGHFLELIGQLRHGKAECDELFLLGLLSLLDSLLGLPMAKIVDRLYLSKALREVLLESGGPLGRYLMLAIAAEKGHPENLARLADQLGYELAAIEEASIEALAWAEEAVRLSV